MIKLYYNPISTYSLRILIAAAEKGIELELVKIDFATRQHKDEEFLRLNPYGRVPAIQDGDFVLYESSSILHYLEEKYPENPLLPRDIQQKSLANLHMRLCDLEFSNQAFIILKQIAFLPKEQWNLKQMQSAKEAIEKHLEILAETVDSKEYIVGDSLTLADICYSTFIYYLPEMGIEPSNKLKPWVNNILSRESINNLLPKKN